MDIRELLEKAEKKLFKVRSVDPDCPLSARGGTRVFFGWVCAARNSKLAPRSKKNSPKIDTPF